MYTINDPMFALILRFVGGNQKIAFEDDKFIKKELKVIQSYIEQFPPEERELRAIEWIEAHAYGYRKTWEKEAIGKEFSARRCSDCPLAVMDASEHCEIHEEWMSLLQQYATGEIGSREYVENALELIGRHKENLKVKLSAIKDAHNGPCRG